VWILSYYQGNLLILPLEQSFVPASCAGRHDLVDPFRNTMAVGASPAFSSVAYCQLLLHRCRQLSRASCALVLKWLIDEVLPGRRIGLLVAAVGLIFVCHQGRAVLTSVGGYWTMLAAQRLGLDMRLRLLRHLDSSPPITTKALRSGASMYPLKEPIEEIAYFGSDLLPAILRTLMEQCSHWERCCY